MNAFLYYRMRIHVNLLWWIDFCARANTQQDSFDKRGSRRHYSIKDSIAKLSFWPLNITSKRYWFLNGQGKHCCLQKHDVWKIVIFISCHSWFIVFLPLWSNYVESTTVITKGDGIFLAKLQRHRTIKTS